MIHRLTLRIKALLVRWIGQNCFQFQCDCGAGLLLSVPLGIAPLMRGGPFDRTQSFSITGQVDDMIVIECYDCHLIYTLRWKGSYFAFEKRLEPEVELASEMLRKAKETEGVR